jgi:cellulose synthase/poly-beta-1,6-N-acetylglucosamine synthase-like glycosyltransferase
LLNNITLHLKINSEKIWILFFCVIVALWFTVVLSTIWEADKNVLIDTDIDLSLPTLIPLALNIMYLCLYLFIFVAYLVGIDIIKTRQLKAISNRHLYDTENLLCTIIIPARNEENVIKRTIDSCLQQTHRNIEVLVICHNSNDGTFSEAQVDDRRVRAYDLKTKETGKGVALNHGVKNAKGEYIMIVDADGILAKDFIENTLPLFYEDSYAAVQGRFISSNRNYNFLTRMLSLEDDLWSAPFMTTRTIIGKRCPLAGTGFIIRKDILLEAGMFSSSLVDDYELSFRLLRNKKKLTYAPLSIVYDEKPPNLSIMFRQRARWAKGFISLLTHRLATTNDVIGNMNWLSPIATLNGLFMLIMISYASIHNLLFEYYPFEFSYLPLEAWIISTALMIILSFLVIIKQFGRKGIVYAAFLPLQILFSHYSLAVTLKGFFVRSWGNTKTMHGFMAKNDLEQILRT